MWLDPQVQRRKFDAEVTKLVAQEPILRSFGCWVQEVTHPNLHLVFVPRHSANVVFPVQSALLNASGQNVAQLIATPLPSLSGRAFGVTIGLDDYDLRPPSVTFVDPWSREPLAYEKMMRGQHQMAPDKYANVLLNPHPSTGLPFLCVRGVREYHEHPQHTGDDWMLYRNDMSVFSVIVTIWRTCVQEARPSLRLGLPQIQILWEAGVRLD